ncbi:hypothetical protein CTAYLR_002506 [Chrysophaeum taylorii]|uniref:CS domain-containing protein n=1 Tax=Chrysophaeum taylorii TaxID=2483200 RepID=A0AAD7UHH8_9STRA|nr:hypothetical protein CTAYLR_002506 [Chrysophaeum taylorii]
MPSRPTSLAEVVNLWWLKKRKHARAGNNAYYYAHQLRANGPQWDGDATPRLIERGSSETTKPKSAITRYSWVDDDSKIKVYVPCEECASDDFVHLDWTEASLVLKIDLPDAEHVLRIPKLYDKIQSATCKVKPGDKVVLTLKKVVAGEEKPHKWWDLKKT